MHACRSTLEDPTGAERNAVAIDWADHELARFTLGDGIQDVRATRDGRLWVSYFDEGVFGNFGWGGGGPAPLGEAGLVAFSETGEVLSSYDAAAAGTDPIADAYTLNVEEDGTVWIYPYTEFPIVRIQQGRYRTWTPGISGARALAARGDQVLLLGDYKQPSLARVVQLGEAGDARVIGQRIIKDPDGGPLDQAFVLGAGARLYLLQERRVLVIEEW